MVFPREMSSCFAFEQSVYFTHALAVSGLKLFHGCCTPLEQQDVASPAYEEGVQCPHCSPLLKSEKRASRRMRERQIQVSRARGKHQLRPQKILCG